MLKKARFRIIAVVMLAYLLVAGGLLAALGIGSYAIVSRDLGAILGEAAYADALPLQGLELPTVYHTAEEVARTVSLGLLSSVTPILLLFMLTLFFLLIPLSKRAVAPYQRNAEAQRRFITDASHELKSPITAISAAADVMMLDHPGDQWVRDVKLEAARLSKLVGDLVTLCRLDEEAPFPEIVPLSLSDLVWELAEPMPSLAKALGKTYEQSIADAVIVKGDRPSLERMVSVLLDNALKYSDENGHIRLTLRRERNRAVLELFNTCDTSHIPDPGRLFDRFYRPDVSRSRPAGGSGVGLSIAKATAQRHGGEITAALEPCGITFTVRL